jgi:hypothetical protein
VKPPRPPPACGAAIRGRVARGVPEAEWRRGPAPAPLHTRQGPNRRSTAKVAGGSAGWRYWNAEEDRGWGRKTERKGTGDWGLGTGGGEEKALGTWVRRNANAETRSGGTRRGEGTRIGECKGGIRHSWLGIRRRLSSEVVAQCISRTPNAEPRMPNAWPPSARFPAPPLLFP